MCGILVVVGKGTQGLDLRGSRRALAGMTWRGPDLCLSETFGERVFIGQTVLSLTGDLPDLSGAEGQPTSRSGRFTVAFNGEIYNFAELARRWLPERADLARPEASDTAVLAELHDRLSPVQVVAELDGMYAYALLDRIGQTLTFVRDVQGEKSLYVYEDEELIVVSSEVAAIEVLRPGLRIDRQALRDYFRTRHLMLFERTAFQGVRQLAPGAAEHLDLRTLVWSKDPPRWIGDWIDHGRMEETASRDVDELGEELDALLRRCVREMIPVGRRYAGVVSGGVDSSLIARYLTLDGSPDVLIAVHHLGKDRISSDLSGFERQLGRRIEVVRADAPTYSAEITRCQKAAGGPLAAHSFVAQSQQSAAVRAAGCRALFGGDGADELFGGYEAYTRRMATPGFYSPSPYTGHTEPEVTFLHDEPTLIQRDLRAAWAASAAAYAHVDPSEDRTALAMMLCDAAYQLPAVALRGADLMSMMWSIEARSVFLRRPVVAFALNLPLRAKVDRDGPPDQRAKVLLKRLFLRHYGPELLAEKQGFAGFPNESALYLGNPSDYLAIPFLGISRASLSSELSRPTAWKLTNVEYFLRGRSVQVPADASLIPA